MYQTGATDDLPRGYIKNIRTRLGASPDGVGHCCGGLGRAGTAAARLGAAGPLRRSKAAIRAVCRPVEG